MGNKIKALVWDWRFHLAWITVLSVVIRSLPAWIYSGWGNDFGIYYSITVEFLDKKNPLYEYPAVWGSSGYGDFPLFYIVIMVAYFITRADPRVLVMRVPPIIGGLSVIPLFFIAYHLTRSRKVSLVAALLLAINPIHVYQTSMPYFLTIAHPIMLTSIYFVLRWMEDDRWLYYLIPFSLLLIFAHHLTTYMFIISTVGIWLVYSTLGKINEVKIKRVFLYVVFYTSATFSYWVIRVEGMYDFLASPYHGVLPWYVTPVAFYIFMLALLRVALRFRITGSSERVVGRLNRLKVSTVFALSLTVGIVFFVALAIFELHGYNIPPISIIYSVPFLLTMGFMGVGLFRIYQNSRLLHAIGGWLGALAISTFLGFLAPAIIPWRHAEYLMEPLSIVGATGIFIVLDSDAFKRVEAKKKIITVFSAPFYVMTHIHSADMYGRLMHTYQISSDSPTNPIEYRALYPIGKRMQIMFISIIIFIMVMTGITAFPLMGKVAPPAQEVSDVVMSGIYYLRDFGDRNYTVATSHKIGTLIAAYGFNSSFEYDYKIWNQTSWVDCLDELEGLNGTYPPIGYVLITREMFEDGVYGYGDLHNPIAPPVMMTNESYAKFKEEPFELIFENHTEDYGDWVEIYWVNWTYIYEHINGTSNSTTSNHEKSLESFYTPWNSHRDFLNFSISCSSEFRRSLFTSMPAIFIMKSRDLR